MKRQFTFLLLAAAAALGGCAAPADDGTAQAEQGVREEARTARTAKDETKTEDPFETDDSLRIPEPSNDRAASGEIPSFDEVAPIFVETCGGCHRPTAFGTIEKVKAQRDEMLARIGSGGMPQNDPTWFQSADGRKVLAFLRNSPELD